MGVAWAKGAPSERACAQRGEWLVTGYYLPLESDFGPLDASALVDGNERRLNLDFMKAVKLQGWGGTRGGVYLGVPTVRKSVSGGASGGETWSFKSSRAPLTSSGKQLAPGDVSADPRLLPAGRSLRIRGTRGGPAHRYRVSDTGGKIKGHHIDVYTGVSGAAAGKEKALAVTGCRQLEDDSGQLLAAQ